MSLLCKCLQDILVEMELKPWVMIRTGESFENHRRTFGERKEQQSREGDQKGEGSGGNPRKMDKTTGIFLFPREVSQLLSSGENQSVLFSIAPAPPRHPGLPWATLASPSKHLHQPGGWVLADEGENRWEDWNGGSTTQISPFLGGNQIFILAETTCLSTEAAHSEPLRSKQHI